MAPSSNAIRVAVPSDAPGGIDARRSEHFGHCDCFTLIDLSEDGTHEVTLVENAPHGGNCLAPIHTLVSNNAHVILVSGMGMRPLIGFRQSGIRVLRVDAETVGDALAAFTEGRVAEFGEQHACGGGHAHGGAGGCQGH